MPSNRCSKTGCRISLSKRSITRPKRSGCPLRRFRQWASYSPLNTSTHADSLPPLPILKLAHFSILGHRIASPQHRGPYDDQPPVWGNTTAKYMDAWKYPKLRLTITRDKGRFRQRAGVKGEKGKRGNGDEKTNGAFSLFTYFPVD